MEDEAILPVAQLLLDCFCEALATTPNPPAKCCFRTGQQVSAGIALNEDECCNGLAWVRVVSDFPSARQFPEQDTEPIGGCPPEWLAVIFELGVLRCVPEGTLQNLPTCEQETAVFTDVMHDNAAMRAAFCCLAGGFDTKVLGVWEPLATEGGCTGGTRIVTVWVPSCMEC